MANQKINSNRKYSPKERVKAGLMAVFPTLETYRCFIEDENEDITPFLNLARKSGIIEKREDGESFEAFILENSRKPKECTPPAGLTFTQLLEDKEKIDTSVRGLTDWINELVKKFELNPMLPTGRVSNAMFTRLGRSPANTSVKRNTLRLLSFWFGYSRPQLGPLWNYETLLRLCPEEEKAEANEGVRIAFDLHSRGDVIEDRMVKWLKKELRSCIEDLGCFHYNRIQSYSTTSFCLDLPNEGSSENGLGHPRSYGRSMRDAISIAHQLSIRWALSPLSSQRRILTIGIAAGAFSNLDIYIQSILNAKLPSNSTIRMTEYAHLCVMINDIRARFCRTPREIDMSNGETVSIWWVPELWNTIYWDFIPQLIEDKMLQTDLRSRERSIRLLWFPEEKTEDGGKELNAITAFLNTPQNSMLGLEIAKTLFYRGRLFDANEILRIILSTDPLNLTARTLRIAIFCKLGGDESVPYSVSELQFKRAYEEAAFVEQSCPIKHEDYYCEHGFGKLAQALRILRLLRENGGNYEEGGIKLKKQDVYRLLRDSEDIFDKGATVSPTGLRSIFMLLCVRSFKSMIEEDQDFLNDSNKRILDKRDVCRKITRNISLALGYLTNDYPGNMKYAFFERRVRHAADICIESVPLRTRVPNFRFILASFFWDFSPIITVSIAQTVIKFLREASAEAKKLESDDLLVVSATGMECQLLPVDTFVRQIDTLIDEVEVRVGKLEDLEGMDDTELIDPGSLGGLKLFCYHV